MNVAALIGIMIAIVVGVCLIPSITDGIDSARNEGVTIEDAAAGVGGLSSAESALLSALPIIFVTIIILGAIAWIGFRDDVRMPSLSWLKRNGGRALGNDEGLIARIAKASENWNEYINNLDEYLEIKTQNAWPLSGIMGLHLSGENALTIDSRGYDWYITDKNPEQAEFKVVGLHKKNAGKNQVYLLGSNGEGPYLHIVPAEYIEADYEECIAHQMVKVEEQEDDEAVSVGGVVAAMTSMAVGAALLPVVKEVVDNAGTTQPKVVLK